MSGREGAGPIGPKVAGAAQGKGPESQHRGAPAGLGDGLCVVRVHRHAHARGSPTWRGLGKEVKARRSAGERTAGWMEVAESSFHLLGLENLEHPHWPEKKSQWGEHISMLNGTGKEMVSLGQESTAARQPRKEGMRGQTWGWWSGNRLLTGKPDRLNLLSEHGQSYLMSIINSN